MEEATNQIERINADELNALLACIRQLYALLSLIATCAQSIWPRARTEQILYPDFVVWLVHISREEINFYSEFEVWAIILDNDRREHGIVSSSGLGLSAVCPVA